MHDIVLAMLVYQNYEMETMLVNQRNPLEIKLFCYE